MSTFNSAYVCHEKIGSGGSGSVYCVTNKNTNKKYAMKQFDISNGMTSDVLVELSILKSTNNEYIVKCYDVFFSNTRGCNKYNEDNLDNKRMYICIILDIGDQTIGQYCKTNILNKSLGNDNFNKILAGAYYLHENNITHNDLGPANIIINDDKSIKIIDMGNCVRKHRLPNSIPTISVRPVHYMKHMKEGTLNNDTTDTWGLGILFYLMTTHKNLLNLNNDCEKEFDEELMKSFSNKKKIKNPIIKQMLQFNQLRRPSVKSIGDLLKIKKDSSSVNSQMYQQAQIKFNSIDEPVDKFALELTLDYVTSNKLSFETVVMVMANYFRIGDIIDKTNYQYFGEMMLVLLMFAYKILINNVDIDHYVNYGKKINVITNKHKLLQLERIIVEQLQWDVDVKTIYWPLPLPTPNKRKKKDNEERHKKINVLLLLCIVANTNSNNNDELNVIQVRTSMDTLLDYIVNLPKQTCDIAKLRLDPMIIKITNLFLCNNNDNQTNMVKKFSEQMNMIDFYNEIQSFCI
jgi:serine/threonine protein kinase